MADGRNMWGGGALPAAVTAGLEIACHPGLLARTVAVAHTHSTMPHAMSHITLHTSPQIRRP